MAHLKRRSVPKKWPVPKKGNTFIVKPNSDSENGIPILIALREMLKLAQNRKEVKNALNSKNILINNKPEKDEKNTIHYLDTLSIVPEKKHYKLEINKFGKFEFEEIKENEINNKITKVIDKKILKGNKKQLNLLDGRNLISNIECKVNDSVIVNFKDKKIEKCLPMKEKSKVAIIVGKHIGKKGIIENLDYGRKIAKVNANGEEINVLIKQLLVIG